MSLINFSVCFKKRVGRMIPVIPREKLLVDSYRLLSLSKRLSCVIATLSLVIPIVSIFIIHGTAPLIISIDHLWLIIIACCVILSFIFHWIIIIYSIDHVNLVIEIAQMLVLNGLPLWILIILRNTSLHWVTHPTSVTNHIVF